MRSLESHDLRKVFGSFTTGVTVITARRQDGAPVGVTANSLTSVSLDPPLLLWCLDNRSRSLGAFAVGGAFAVHVLGEAQGEVAKRFARSGVSGFGTEVANDREAGPPEIGGAIARSECRVVALHAGGDHTIIVGEVLGASSTDEAPLAFQRSRFGRFVPDPVAGGDESWRPLIDMWS